MLLLAPSVIHCHCRNLERNGQIDPELLKEPSPETDLPSISVRPQPLVSLRPHPYQIPLSKNFENSKNKYNNQKGVIVTIETNNFIGKGEAVILKGFTHYTLQEIIWSMESFLSAIEKNENYLLDELLMTVKIHCSETPTLQFAIETALYDIESQKKKVSIARFFNKNSSDYVNCSQILINRETQSRNNINKIKIGVNRLEDDIKFLKKFYNKNSNKKIRLDANQLFSVNEFDNFYKQISNLNIDFFEEPLKNPTLEKINFIKSKYPKLNYALDESIYQTKNYKSWIDKDLISVLIIRPSILGSYEKFFKLKKLYNKNLSILISSSLENSIGNMAIIHLASTLENQSKHGVNIFSFYDKFIIPPLYKNDRINLQSTIGLGFKC